MLAGWTSAAASALNTLDGKTTLPINAATVTTITGTSVDVLTAFNSTGIVLGNAAFQRVGVANIVAAVGTAEHVGVKAHATCPSIRAFAALSPYSGRTEEG